MTAPAVATTAPAAGWHPERPKFRPLHVLRTWLFSAIALVVAAALLPGAEVNGLVGCDRRRGGHRGAERDPPAARRRAAAAVHARARLPDRPRARRVDAARGRQPDRRRPERRRVRVGAAGRARRVGGDARPRGRGRGRRRQRVLLPRHPADRPAHRRADPDGRPRDRLPRDRRARAPGPPSRDAGRQRPQHGPLDRRGRVPPDRLGDRPLVPDRREPGGDPARLEREHPGLPLGREGHREGDDLLGACGLRGDRAAPRDRQGPPDERRGEPRQPPLRPGRRGDPHGEPHRGREAGESRLPDVLRQRLQRDPGARPRRLGGDPRVDGRPEGRPARRPPARPPRRRLPVHARRDVHRRPRPDRPVGAHGHDEGTARGLRDLLELRRGRPPLGPRARRHARGAPQARPAVRAHREGPPLRAPSLRDRRPLRPRSDAGGDVQAAERPRARRARPALARGGRRDVPHERRRERQCRRSPPSARRRAAT